MESILARMFKPIDRGMDFGEIFAKIQDAPKLWVPSGRSGALFANYGIGRAVYMVEGVPNAVQHRHEIWVDGPSDISDMIASVKETLGEPSEQKIPTGKKPWWNFQRYMRFDHINPELLEAERAFHSTYVKVYNAESKFKETLTPAEYRG